MAESMTKSEAIAIMTERIASAFHPEKIILFGSCARGDAQLESDIDLLVVMSECKNRRATTVSMMKSVSDLPVSKDIVVTTAKELETRGKLASTVLYPAVREGKVLYGG